MIYWIFAVVLVILFLFSLKSLIRHIQILILQKKVWMSLNEKYDKDEKFRELGDDKDDE